MKDIYLCFLFLFLSIYPKLAFAQLTGQKYIPGDYPTIANAIDSLNLNGVGSGGVVFNVIAGHTETGSSLILTASGTATNPVVFQKFGSGANPKITAAMGSNNIYDCIICLEGADYITFDGLDLEENPINATNTERMESGIGFFMASSSDGCRYNTIKNCKIEKLGYGFGIRAFPQNSSAGIVHNPVNFLATHSYNKIYYNEILNSQFGIAFYGAPDFSSYGNEIGVEGGNLINTGYLNAYYPGGGNPAGGGHGITCTNSEVVIANNIIDYTINIGFNGIRAENLNLIGNIEIYNNFITANLSGTNWVGMIGIVGEVFSSEIKIYDNTLTNISYMQLPNGGSGLTGIAVAGNQTSSVKIYNNFLGNFEAMNTLHPTIGIILKGSMEWELFSNQIVNIETIQSPSGGPVIGIKDESKGKGMVYENTISGLSQTAILSPVYGYYNENAPLEQSIRDNIIKNIKTSGSGQAYGIFGKHHAQQVSLQQVKIEQNLIDSIGSSYGSAAGIIFQQQNTNGSIRNNKISNICGGDGFFTTCNAVSFNQGSWEITNNLIGNIYSSGSGSNAVSGIHIGGGTSHKLYYNSIFLDAFSTGNFGSSGISLASTFPVVDIRNNLVINKSIPSGTGITAAFRSNFTSLASISDSSNNNLFYAGTPSPNNIIYHNGSNTFQTLQDYKTHVSPRDSNTYTEDVVFVSTSPASPDFLRPDSLVPTYLESGAQNIPNLTDDFFIQNIRTALPMKRQVGAGKAEFYGICFA